MQTRDSLCSQVKECIIKNIQNNHLFIFILLTKSFLEYEVQKKKTLANYVK